MLVTYLIAIAAGFAAALVHLPLPWMLGPFFVCGAISAAGGRLAFIPMGREIGQIVIGISIGMRFTPAILQAMLGLLPAMLLCTLYVIAFTMVSAYFFRRLAGVDEITAFFATAAGGVADMASVAREHGGDSNAVAIVHALRVSTVVSIVPIMAVAFGQSGQVGSHAGDLTHSLPLLIVVLGGGYLAARVLKPTPLPNIWLVGPILLALFLSATGMLSLSVPPSLILIAQIIIGTWLGCHFRRDIIAALPRVAASGFAVAIFMITAAAGGAFVLTGATQVPYTTSFLALAPAAVTEMVLTAQYMHLDAELVTAFHIMRITLISSTILPVFAIYKRLFGSEYDTSP